MDEVAFPIVLAWQLGRTGPRDWDNVRRSADFLVAEGPRSDQERWENIGGFSPATIAAEIAGLVTRGRHRPEERRAGAGRPLPRGRRRVAVEPRALDAHPQRAAVAGALLPAHHRRRRRERGHPDPDRRRRPAGRPAPRRRPELPGDGAAGREVGRRPQHRLDPARHRPRADVRRRPTAPSGTARSFDGYGERPDGSQWEPVDPGSGATIGRGWPLLTGERGEYALAAGQPAQVYLDTMARVAEDSGGQVIAEQVWDLGPPAGTGARLRPRREHLLGHAARVVPLPAHPAGPLDRRRRAGRDAAGRRVPLRDDALPPLRRRLPS